MKTHRVSQKRDTITKNYKISDLTPAEYNPRSIDEQSLLGLKNSLQEFGVVQPIVFNVRTKRIVGGHQRVKAYHELGYTEIPVIEVDLSTEKEKALNVTLNNKFIEGDFTSGLEDVLLDIDDDLKMDLRLDKLAEAFDVTLLDEEPDSDNVTPEKKYDTITIKDVPKDKTPELLDLINAAIEETGYTAFS